MTGHAEPSDPDLNGPNPGESRKHQKSELASRWQIERIDTELMTAAQYQNAVNTLAALIKQWRSTNATDRP